MKRKVAAVLLASLPLAACGSGDDEEITVFAAASLNEVYPDMADQAEIDASFSFDGSSGLVDQLEGGAPADVLATADTANMDRAVEAGLIEGDPVAFAGNELVIAVAEGNPREYETLQDIADDTEGNLVVCEPSVPCGNATAELSAAQGVDLSPVSEEPSVTDVLGKVSSGEADSGLVYTTDTADGVEHISIDGSDEHGVVLWVGVLAGSDLAGQAQEFMDFVTSEEGFDILDGYGFQAAP